MTAAVIDLGTNTFHLLVASIENQQLIEVLRKRRFVKLGKDGIGRISEETLARARACLELFRDELSAYENLSIRILGTAALRSSDNAHLIVTIVRELFDSPLEIIDGKREAELIYKGVCFKGYPNEDNNLIVDIGGGSIEFIIFRKDFVHYKSSINIGIGWMYHKFKHSDPITSKEIRQIEDHLQTKLQPVQEALIRYQPSLMIGASGTFDLLFNHLGKYGADETIQRLQLLDILNEYIGTTVSERQLDARIPPSRVDYVPLAFLLLRFFLSLDKAPEQIAYSPYALKEGVLREMFLG